MADDDILSIPVKSDEDTIEDIPEVTGPNILRKIGYVERYLDMGKSAHIRYVSLRFRDYLDLRRTESKNERCGLLLFHDRDIEILRYILTMKDVQKMKDADIIDELKKAADGIPSMPSSYTGLTANDKAVIDMLSGRIIDALISKLSEQDDTMKNMEKELLDQREATERMEQEVSLLREELRKRDDEQKVILERLNEAVKPRKKFLGLF